MGAARAISSWVLLVAAALAAAKAVSVPVEGSPKHRRRSPLSPAQSFADIDKQYAAVGNHQHHQQEAAGARLAFRQPDVGHHQPASHANPAPPSADHHAGPATSYSSHKSSHGPHKHRAAANPAAAPKKHRVGPKSLHHGHEAQMASSDHVATKASGRGSSGKSHEYSGAKASGGGRGERHHYEHNRGEDEKQHHARDYEEGEGAKTHHHDDDHHSSSHDRSGHGGHHGKHMEFNHRDKSGFTKGFRDKYRKDESHKLDKYWSNGHEKGAYEKFGLHNSHHHNSDKGKVKKSQHKEGKTSDSYGKRGQGGKGHVDGDRKGHRSHGGYESQHGHHKDYSKKGGSSLGNAHHFEHGKGKA